MLGLNLLISPIEAIRNLLQRHKLRELDYKPECNIMLHTLGISTLIAQYIMDLKADDFSISERYPSTSRYVYDYQRFLDVLWEHRGMFGVQDDMTQESILPEMYRRYANAVRRGQKFLEQKTSVYLSLVSCMMKFRKF